MRRPRGQMIPLLALLLPVFILFIGAHLKRSLAAVAKIENQREADLLVLSLANERARALNAVAALNEGLAVARERGRAVQVALLTLEACVASLFGSPACAPALASLGRKAVPFYRKLEHLGIELARMQDEILRRAEEHPARFGELYNASHLRRSRIFLYPSGRSVPLPVTRRNRSFSLLCPVPIPEPYVLERRDEIALGRVTKFSRRIDALLRRTPSETIGYIDLWAISEAESAGTTLSEMRFRPRLRAVSLERPLWNTVRRDSLPLLGFEPPPDWSSKRAALSH